jgi:hypothetical protein
MGKKPDLIQQSVVLSRPQRRVQKLEVEARLDHRKEQRFLDPNHPQTDSIANRAQHEEEEKAIFACQRGMEQHIACEGVYHCGLHVEAEGVLPFRGHRERGTGVKFLVQNTVVIRGLFL